MKQLFKKIILRIFIISLLAFNYSCEKNSEKIKDEQKDATVNALIKNQSFINYVALLDDIVAHIQNAPILNTEEKNKLKLFLNSKTVSENQLTIVSKNTGFNSLNDYINIFNKQDQLLTSLKNEFKNIESISVDSLYEAISIVHSKNIIKIKPMQLSPEELCRRIYSNCNSRASATYTAAAVGCTVTAIGVGAGTALVGGVVYQIGCGGLAYWYLLLQRDECSLNYETCIKK
jgi:hypothetical protein